MPSGPGVSLIELRLPNLGAMQALANWLLVDAMDAADSGRGNDALVDVRAVITMADQAGEHGVIISQLVSMAIFQRVCAVVRLVMDRWPGLWGDEELSAVTGAISAYQGGVISCDISMERDSFCDSVQRLYTDDGHGDGVPCAKGFAEFLERENEMGKYMLGGVDPRSLRAPLAAQKLASRRELLEKYTEIMDAAEQDASLPLWERSFSFGATVQSLAATDGGRFSVITSLLPAADRFYANAELAVQWRDVTLAVVALERFRRRHGRWPATLEEMVPEFLAEVPIDRSTGDPVGYVASAGAVQPMLYSRGADRDDDGGRVPVDADGDPDPKSAEFWDQYMRAHGDGDWVLWPPAPPESR
jgi:hypothetical protein